MSTFVFVLAIISASGREEWSVLDSQLTIAQCARLLSTAPRPFYMPGVKVMYSCQPESE